MSRWYLFALTVLFVSGIAVAAEPATDLLGDPLPDEAVQRLGSLRLRYGSVGDIDYLPDGGAVVAFGTSIDIWDMSVGEKQATHRIGSRNLTGIDISEDGNSMLAGDSGGNLYEWDMEEEKVIEEWETGQDGLASVYYSTDETRALTCGTNPPTIKEWELQTNEELVSITANHLAPARAAIYGPDDQSAFIHGRAGSHPVVEQYDLSDGTLIRDFLADYYTHTRSVMLSPDGERLLVGSRTRATEWQIEPEFELLNTFTGHAGHAATAVSYAHDADELLTGSRDGSIRRWNRLEEGGEVLARWFAHGSSLTGISHLLVSLDGQWVLSYSQAGRMLIESSITDGARRLPWSRHELSVQAAAIMTDGRVISGSEDRTVRVWDMLSGEETLLIDEPTEQVWAVASSPDGERIAAGYRDGVVREFTTSDGTLLRELTGHSGYVRSVEYMPSLPPDKAAPALLTAADDGTIRMWGKSGDEPLHVFEADLHAEDGHRGGVLCLAISEDGSELLSGGRDGTMRLWDLQQRTQKQVFGGHRGWVSAVAFAGDTGEVLSATQRFGVVRRWDLSTGEVLGEMTHTSGLRSLACTNRGDMVFAGGANGTISVWNRDGQQLDVLKGHKLSVNSLAVSADNAHLVSASGDATLLVWETPQQ